MLFKRNENLQLKIAVTSKATRALGSFINS